MKSLRALGLDDGAALAAFELDQDFDGFLFGHQALGGVARGGTGNRTEKPQNLAFTLHATSSRASNGTHNTPHHTSDAALAAVHRNLANAEHHAVEYLRHGLGVISGDDVRVAGGTAPQYDR